MMKELPCQQFCIMWFTWVYRPASWLPFRSSWELTVRYFSDHSSCELKKIMEYFCKLNTNEQNSGHEGVKNPRKSSLFENREISRSYMYQPRSSAFFQNLYGSTATRRTHVRFVASRYLLFFSQRNMERKIDARKGAWKGEEKGGKASCFSSFLPLMHCKLTKSFPLTTALIQISDWVRVWTPVIPLCRVCALS